MKALIVDDEPLARLELRRLLAAFTWVQIVGEASNIDEARVRIETLAPDLTFLDVQMPGGTGFDLLAQLDRPPRVVFTTAYDHYAVKAFEVSALDYLLKPIEPERLAAALDKIHTSMSSRAMANDEPLEQLFVRDGPRCWFLPLREVSLFVAEGNYVRLYWGKERPVLGRSLATVEEKLDAKSFFRANRRQIVNLEFVQSVRLGSGGRLLAKLRDGSDVEISRRQARLFRARMTV
ncbi:LytR/AlgR family response regulator transcription factor [Bradyrhizobium sp. CCBAU 11361]|uniref:LytR/AlgR family response regulator transcription factor n=1 Tax=Bradyrhizobium sp. CCBAU 11361 TaxID=1630812 RepID=UPI0023064B53|nr:response regulator [Bradyrhizobium sp. CCBAU 11361]MDA9491775.1 transcriptional regulator [Bradyrhizobium sp. CCBAU 11361]